MGGGGRLPRVWRMALFRLHPPPNFTACGWGVEESGGEGRGARSGFHLLSPGSVWRWIMEKNVRVFSFDS